MKITFAGKFESALIRSIDEVLTPDRNASIHEYYAALNRNVTSNYFDRCGTFLALADLTLVPTVDWNYPYDAKYRGALSEVDLGVIHSPTGGNEWDDAVVKFAELILKRHVLSASSTSYISNLTLAHYTQEKGDHVRANIKRYGKAAARHYLCRLFLQLKSGRESGAYVILSEEDTVILQEVGRWAARVKPPIPFEIPDLKGRLIEPESFASGLLNFRRQIFEPSERYVQTSKYACMLKRLRRS